MAFFKQVITLMGKNLRILLLRHLALCVWMGFVLPIFLASLFTFTKNLLVPPAEFGIGKPSPILTLAQAFESAQSNGRNKIALVDNGFTSGDIDRVLSRLKDEIHNASAYVEIVRLSDEDELASACRTNLRGVSGCYGAVVMRSSPDQGKGGIWNYTIRSDGTVGQATVKFNVNKKTNDQQVYLIPIQHAVDKIIAGLNSTAIANKLANIQQYAFTSLSDKERDEEIRQMFQKTIKGWMGVAFLGTVVWVSYHLTGFVATERESGMSTLIDSMMPVRRSWLAMAARILAHHFSFSLIYLPAWVVGSLIVRSGVFSNTNLGIVLIFHVLGGLAFSSMSLLFASFFKKAQLSGITAILSIALLGILAQSLTSPGTAIVAVLSFLFTPCTFVFFLTHMARFEEQGKATDLAAVAPNSPWSISGIVLWVFLIIQIFVYPLIGALVEHALYSNDTPGRQVLLKQDKVDALGGVAVRLQQFTKIYNPSIFSRIFNRGSKRKQPVVAVDGLNLDVGQGQIVALLGANGSGKSTTLDAIAGMSKLTKGSIQIDGRAGLGIAPQKNVLWDDLTVEEHIRIFNHLKAPNARATTANIHELIKSVDLWKKRKALAKTLSGGQKRKLQLGMMLTGGSGVCCVDEVSSGIDPLSRRKLWDIILAERGRRTMILTTHFLDEADLLADHIAILSKGTLRAEGSSVALKDSSGGGYKVHVPKDAVTGNTPDIEGVEKKDAFDLVTYIAPTSQLAATVIKELEAAVINEYRFSGPTIEDVFLQVAEEIKDEEAFRNASAASNEKVSSEGNDSGKQGLQLMDGRKVGYVEQAIILFRKRLTIIKRNRLLYLFAFVLPIFAAGMTSLFVQGENPPTCNPADQSSRNSGSEDAFSQAGKEDEVAITFMAGPSSKITTETFAQVLAPVLASMSNSSAATSATSNLKIVDTFGEFDTFIKEYPKNITTGFWLGDDQQPPTFAWVANLVIANPLLAQQLLNTLATSIVTRATWDAFERPLSTTAGDSLQLVVYMCIALSAYPAFFSLYPSNERRRFVRGLQYSNGVRSFPLWIAYLLFDFIIVLASSALVTAIWAGVSNIWFNLGYVFLILILYGIAATLHSYLISLFAKTQLGTYAWAAATQLLVFVAYVVAYMSVLTYSPPPKTERSLDIVHFVTSIFAPIGSMARALFVTTNLFSTACENRQAVTTNPSGIKFYGGPILYLIVQSFILFGLIIWFDTGSAVTSLRSLSSVWKKEAKTEEEAADEDVKAELSRVTGGAAEENGLRVLNLTKSFRRNTAVDNVSFGIKRGEVFALLGPNGAGKSTTISLIRGDIRPDHRGGDVLVEHASVTKNLALARKNLGVCPQFDAMDQMTVREHLEFYAKIRGIQDVGHNVRAVMQAVGLESFSSRMAHALSGGNKRKLSLGIALMGNPTVVLLDEPSSGLDAASKRVMWKTLEATVPGRSILLTTHSMEEANALAGRVGILARRMLAVGTPDGLRHRFGDALHIHLVSTSAPRTSQAEMAHIIDWIRRTLPLADVEEKTYHGQIRFSVSASQVLAATSGRDAQEMEESGEDLRQSAIGHLVVLLEENKEQLGVGHYSVSPTTLDQVFLTIVGQHNVKEENSEEKPESTWRRLWRFGRS